MDKQITKQYKETAITFSGEGWFNATEAAAKFGKRPVDWLALESTKEYLGALCESTEVRKSHFVKTVKGGDISKQGTWLHPKLGVVFARWLDVRFAVWCDEQIDAIVRGTFDIKRVRHEAASSYKTMTAILQEVRSSVGKDTPPHVYSNEARLINWVLSGEFKSIDRDLLSFQDLDLLAKLEVRDAVLLGRGYTYEQRKSALRAYADDCRSLPLAA